MIRLITKIKFLFVITFLLNFILLNYQNVYALSCIRMTPEESINSSEYIFVGKVLSVDREKAIFDIEKYWKKQLSQRETIYNTTYWTGMPGGEIFFEVGKKYIVYASFDNDKIVAGIDCSRTSLYSKDHEEEIEKILGKANNLYYNNQDNTCESIYKLKSNLSRRNKLNNQEEIIILQNFFKNYYKENDFIVNGVFDKATRDLVVRFQKDNKIIATGIVGKITRKKIQDVCGKNIKQNKEENITFCPTLYKPVCGKDKNGKEKTFGNDCELKVSGAIKQYDGECKKSDDKISSDCKAWYDGCNNCSRSSSNAVAICTLKYCENYEKPKCLEYFSKTKCYADGASYNEGDAKSCINGVCIADVIYVCRSGEWKIEGGKW